MLSECSLMLGLLSWNRREEGAGSSWEDFWTTTLLKSAGSVCERFMETTTKQRHWQLQTGTLMYKCTCCAHTHDLYTYTHARTSLHVLPRTLNLK